MPTGERNTRVALLCLLATGVLIGLSTNLAKVAADIGFGALAFLGWSVAGAAGILFVAGAIQGTPLRPTRRVLEYFVVSGALSLAVPNLLLFAAVPEVGPAFVVLSLAFPPLYTYVGALALRMERWSAVRAAGVVLALCGGGLLAILKLQAPDTSPWWVVATLTAPVLLAAGNIYRSARWPKGASPEALAPGMLAASAVQLVLFGAVSRAIGLSGPAFSLAIPTGSAMPWLLLVAQTVTFAATYALFFVLQRAGGPVYLSLIGSVAAITGVPFAVVVLGETTPDGLIGASLLIATGIVLLTRSQRD